MWMAPFLLDFRICLNSVDIFSVARFCTFVSPCNLNFCMPSIIVGIANMSQDEWHMRDDGSNIEKMLLIMPRV